MKKHLTAIVVGLVLFLIGIACFYIETINYSVSSDLTSNFVIKQKTTKYNISDDVVYRITNDDTDKNMNLYIDNTLKNEIRVVVEYADVLEIDYDSDDKRINKEEFILLNIESDLVLDTSSIKELYKLGINGLKNKTIYNYTLLKYPKIKIYVNEKYKNNIKFVDKYGKEYTQIG